MIHIGEALYKTLLNNADVFAYTHDRIYPNWKPQNCPLPAISFFRVHGRHETVHQGGAGLCESRYQLDVWAPTYKECRDLGEVLRGLLLGFKGQWFDLTVAVPSMEENDTGESAEGAEVNTQRLSFDIQIWHQETLSNRS